MLRRAEDDGRRGEERVGLLQEGAGSAGARRKRSKPDANLEDGKVWCAKVFEDKVDLEEEVVCAELRAPSRGLG